jgi:hypothetical protein
MGRFVHARRKTMPFRFASVDRAKSAARRLQTVASEKHGIKLPLTQWQDVVARFAGAADWKALSRSVADFGGEPDPLDHQLPDLVALVERRDDTVRAFTRLLHEIDAAVDLAEDPDGLGELIAEAEPTGNGNGPFVVRPVYFPSDTPIVVHRLAPLDRADLPRLAEFPLPLKRVAPGRLALRSCQDPARWRELARRIPVRDDFDRFYADDLEYNSSRAAIDPGMQMIEWDGEVVGYLQLTRHAPLDADVAALPPAALLRRGGAGLPEAASHLVVRIETLYVLPEWRQVERWGDIRVAVTQRLADLVLDDAIAMAAATPGGDVDIYLGGEPEELVNHVVHGVRGRVGEGLILLADLSADGPDWNGRKHPAERVDGPFEDEVDGLGPVKGGAAKTSLFDLI